MAKIIHTNPGVGIETAEEWMGEDMHELDEDGELIVTNPPSGYYKVYGIYMTKIEEKYFPVFVHSDTPE